jgi:multiple sugar transport system permease protein
MKSQTSLRKPPWGPLSAGVILSTVPVAVLFSFLQRLLIHGLTAGAVKG